MLTPEDIQNLIKIMNRATYDGLAEAAVAVGLQGKLSKMLKPEPVQLSTDPDA